MYGVSFNLFFKDYVDLSNREKIDKLKEYPVSDLLTLLRNIEESPRQFDKEIIKGVYSCLYNKKIMCI